MKYLYLFTLLLLGTQGRLSGQVLDHIAPSNWWVGMQNPHLQILLHGEGIAARELSLQPYSGVKIAAVSKVENSNYLFVDVTISKDAKPGFLTFSLQQGKNQSTFAYELKKRENWKPRPLDSSDFIYLLMPDRFSNGDLSNDRFEDMADTISDRSNPWARHGGDLQGVINHLDYFKELGVTALWLNPVIENDQYQTEEGGNLRSAYHGYGFTDHYHVDRRLGGNEKYRELIEKAHDEEIKIIQDAVYNHFGINHWTLQDLPMKSWLNQWERYTNTSYKDQPVIDPYASEYDRKQVQNGWFVPHLPDVNHKNPFLANYLIQHALWTMEYFHIDAWRVDTYFYNDLEFMNRCNEAILKEYPTAFIFGESWVNSVTNQAYLTENNLDVEFKSNLPSQVDFQTYFAIKSALNEPYGWNEGVQKLYQTLAQDLLYKYPEKLITFLDNHDLDRFLSVVQKDEKKLEMGLVWLMTLRGIPQIYYGTEVGVTGHKSPSDAEVRKDFIGGWAGDKVNKFTAAGRTLKEQKVFDLVKKLSHFRSNSNAISKGNFTQYLPFNEGVYVYFRHSKDDLVMVLSNTSEKVQTFSGERFSEFLNHKTFAKDILSNRVITDLNTFSLQPKEVQVLQIKK